MKNALRLNPVSALLRLRMALGYIPNMEWFRARLTRAVVLDRAKAQLAIAELERCLLLRRNGSRERCFGRLRR